MYTSLGKRYIVDVMIDVFDKIRQYVKVAYFHKFVYNSTRVHIQKGI